MKPRIALLANKIFVEECCVICGEFFETGEILPELYDEDGHLMGYVCDACAYKPQAYTGKLRARVKRFEDSAARFKRLADIGIELPDADYRLKLESHILVGDSKEIDKLNVAESEKDRPGEGVKGKKLVSLTWNRDSKKLVLFFEGDTILWVAPAREGKDGELVVNTDGMLILGEGLSGEELIDYTEGDFKPAPGGSTWHK